MKQDRQGDGGNEASGGRGSRKTQHSRVRQARCRSLPATSCAVGARNLRRGMSTRLRGFGRCKANGRSGSGQTLEQSEVHERIRRKSNRFRRPGTRGKTSKASLERGKGHGGVVEPM
jgi:hypothetical protein